MEKHGRFTAFMSYVTFTLISIFGVRKSGFKKLPIVTLLLLNCNKESNRCYSVTRLSIICNQYDDLPTDSGHVGKSKRDRPTVRSEALPLCLYAFGGILIRLKQNIFSRFYLTFV